jgi:hypothetical protein
MDLSTFFKEQNFCSVALPTTDMQVLQILLRTSDGAFQRLGSEDIIQNVFASVPMQLTDLQKVFRSEQDVAGELYIKSNRPLPNMTGTCQIHLNVNASVKVPTKETSLTTDSNAQLMFLVESPVMDSISSFMQLDDCLNQSVLKQHNNYAKMLVNNEIYIITDVLKTKKLIRGVIDTRKIQTDIHISAFQDLLKSDFTAGRDKGKNEFFMHDNDEPIVFAIKAAKIQYDRTLKEWYHNRKGLFRIVKQSGTVVKHDEDLKIDYLNFD